MISFRDDRFELEFLEMMMIRGCNLSCQGCTTFSDLKHAGYVTWEIGQQWLEPWTDRLDIKAVGLMGGEPLMNPQVRDWLQGLRKLLPDAQIRFVTNGFLLEKHWDIVELLDQLGNCVLKISYHIRDQRLDSIVSRIFQSRKWQPILEFGIDRWVSPTGLRFQIAKPKKFFKTFRGNYIDMAPHDNDPVKAFELCVQKKCPLLNQGRIWKCGTLALTPDLLDRMGRPNYDQWQPFIDSGLAPDCDALELKKFIANFGHPHRHCRQCPCSSDLESILDHTTTVTFK